jgi:NADH/NAD ratio-sensing transcriptional regulator Rex
VYAGRRCFHLDQLEKVLPDFGVRIAVLACRPPGLQRLVDRLGDLGVRSVLNFVPKRVRPAPGGHVEHIDISGKLEMLSFLSCSGT